MTQKQQQREIASELTLRAQSLPDEMLVWQKLAMTNTQGFGIHKSQIAALNLLLDKATARQTAALAALLPDAPPDKFAAQRQNVEQQITSAHLLLGVFRYVLQQRTGKKSIAAAPGTPPAPPTLDPLDLADLVAARAYRHCLDVAKDAQVITGEQFREPPLCYFNAQRSPTAFTRRHVVGAFEFRFSEEVTAKLPVSVLSLPAHFARAVWTYNTLFHEIGHLVDQDLGLKAALVEPLRAVASPETFPTWESWLREAIADAFGLLLGGAAFAQTMAKLLYLPDDDMTHQNPKDVHPTPCVRLHLVAAMLEVLGETAAAAEIGAETTARCGTPIAWPGGLPTLAAECLPIANAVLKTPLAAVGNRALQDFARPADWSKSADDLAFFLREGALPPDAESFPIDTVPVAAQQAVATLSVDLSGEETAKRCRSIHERALRFAQRIKRPNFLNASFYVADGSSEARKAHLQSRADDALRLLESGSFFDDES